MDQVTSHCVKNHRQCFMSAQGPSLARWAVLQKAGFNKYRADEIINIMNLLLYYLELFL